MQWKETQHKLSDINEYIIHTFEIYQKRTCNMPNTIEIKSIIAPF